jgi:two-component system CheB/CheR fusion protein
LKVRTHKNPAKSPPAPAGAKVVVSPARSGKTARPSATARAETSSGGVAGFPIVGIGASAGGLEALELFLGQVPEASGLAFIIVQHLDPMRKGIMPELLQRCTPMKVMQVLDRTPVRPDCVYVIPPNNDLSILHGTLHLLRPVAPRGLRRPIDFFFRALADDQQEQSVGVILSGMGSDGTVGLRSIKEHAGLTLVQEPASAKFDGMPRSAIDAGLADIVAPAADLPAKILEYLRHSPLLASPARLEGTLPDGQLEKVIMLLRSRTGHDFSLYKRSTLYRRVERRMGLHKISKIGAYVGYLRENPAEVEQLFKELLIGVTSFFRDPAAWRQLRDELLPELLTGSAAGQTLRAWVPGCSTGEEAFTLAIIFLEARDALTIPPMIGLQIFATDLDRDAVDRARLGFYPASIATEVSPERLSRFFVEEDRGFRVAKAVRDMVIFAPQNLIKDPPFTKLDILVCRNLLIYFTAELQQKLFPLFYYSLNPGGLLFLGTAESIGRFTDLFTPCPGNLKLYRGQKAGHRTSQVEFPSAFVAPLPHPPQAAPARRLQPDNLASLAGQWLLQCHAPAAVLVDDHGDILYTSGHTGRYLEPVAGKANWNVFVMAREDLRYELSQAFPHARRQPAPVTVPRLKFVAGGMTHFVDLSVQFLAEPAALRGLAMIVFTEVAAPPAPATKGKTAPVRSPGSDQGGDQELLQARAELQTTREVMQSAQEELRSMNEELQSANEELQSTNEELTTSKEEMQSLNEELNTVNAELQMKVDELNATSNDMKNLLNSTDIATVFLDNALRVRRFTEQATKLIKLIPGDIGRPVTDLATNLLYPALADDAREVLRTLVPVEKSLASRDGAWFAMRLLPYRTMDDRISGLVITFTDITAAKKLESQLRAQLESRAPGPA